jgi:hypothetical protein
MWAIVGIAFDGGSRLLARDVNACRAALGRRHQPVVSQGSFQCHREIGDRSAQFIGFQIQKCFDQAWVASDLAVMSPRLPRRDRIAKVRRRAG